MSESSLMRASKFLSLILRHDPGKAGITLDAHGWAPITKVLKGLKNRGYPLTEEQLRDLVATDNKGRYTISDDGRRIRAAQGHSVPVDLGLKPVAPPEFLYHGTVPKVLPQIRVEGLKAQSRQYVHLSADRVTAEQVGARRGVPVILSIRAGDLYRAGHPFYCAENGVWLTDAVPPEGISFP